MFDLKLNNVSEQSEAGHEFELVYPITQEKTGAFIKVRGSQSPKAKAHARKKYAEYRLREQMAKRKGKEEIITLDEAEDMAIESAIVRIISWRGIAEEGKEVPFTKENAERILREHVWIREAVQEAADQLLNFQ